MLLTCEEVHQDALQQLRIPAHALKVSKISTAMFLLHFETPEMRNAAHARRSLAAGRISLHLMPWGRQVRATKSHFFYRARICIEGVPDHAHQMESVVHLLPTQSFVEGVDFTRERDDEKGCFILWIWCHDPDAVAVQGSLKIEEPEELPEEYYGSSHLSVLRADAMAVFGYDVIIHLDLACLVPGHSLPRHNCGAAVGVAEKNGATTVAKIYTAEQRKSLWRDAGSSKTKR